MNRHPRVNVRSACGNGDTGSTRQHGAPRPIGSRGALLLLPLLLLGVGRPAQALVSYQFAFLSYPGAAFTQCAGINDAGDVVGWYGLPNEQAYHGFLYQNGVFATTFDYPGALRTFPMGINNHGDIVGAFITSIAGDSGSANNPPLFEGRPLQAPVGGFQLHQGVFTPVDPGFAGATHVVARGVNDARDVVGSAEGGSPTLSGFLLRSGVPVRLDFPNEGNTVAAGINNLGQIALNMPSFVGMATVSGNVPGYASLLVAPPIFFSAFDQGFGGLNDVGQFTGNSADAPDDGWVLSNGSATYLGTFAPLGYRLFPYAINNHGVVVGVSSAFDPPFPPSGCFVATPHVTFARIRLTRVAGPVSVPPGVPVMRLRFQAELGAESNGVDPNTEPVALGLGGLALTVPPGSFRGGLDGSFHFRGRIERVGVAMEIRPGPATTGVAAPGVGRALEVDVELVGVPALDPAIPIVVSLTIGDDTGSAALPPAPVPRH